MIRAHDAPGVSLPVSSSSVPDARVRSRSSRSGHVAARFRYLEARQLPRSGATLTRVFYGPGNGSPMATNVIVVLVLVLGVVVIRFSIP